MASFLDIGSAMRVFVAYALSGIVHVATIVALTFWLPEVAMVEMALQRGDVHALLTAGGFVGVETTFRGASPCFQDGAAALRETRIVARAGGGEGRS